MYARWGSLSKHGLGRCAPAGCLFMPYFYNQERKHWSARGRLAIGLVARAQISCIFTPQLEPFYITWAVLVTGAWHWILSIWQIVAIRCQKSSQKMQFLENVHSHICNQTRREFTSMKLHNILFASRFIKPKCRPQSSGSPHLDFASM